MMLARKWQEEWFAELLSEAGNIEIATYCLMDNHIHMVVMEELTELSEAIKKITIK
jgi:REP element-mobilizing transposase RayT